MPDPTPWNGYPENPERSGWHWLKDDAGAHECWYWRSTSRKWDDETIFAGRDPASFTGFETYIGPASPDDAAEVRRLREGIRLIARRAAGDSSVSHCISELRALLEGPADV